MKQTLTALALIAALTGCAEKPQEADNSQIRAGITVIEDALYKATLTDRDGDGLNDVLMIERKLGSDEWKKFRGTRIEYFVTSLPTTPFPRYGEVVNVVKPEFFDQYKALLTPNRELITSTYRGQ